MMGIMEVRLHEFVVQQSPSAFHSLRIISYPCVFFLALAKRIFQLLSISL
jgi:hypothetical protein